MEIRTLFRGIPSWIGYVLTFGLGLTVGLFVERGIEQRLDFADVSTAVVGLLFLFSLGLFFLTVRLEGAPLIESHWGGLGGSMTGWRVSPSLLYLFIALFLALALTLALGRTTGPGSSAPPKALPSSAQQVP